MPAIAGIVGFAAVSVPELSVVCVAGEQRQRVRRCLAALAAQTAVGRIEVLVVDAGGAGDPIALPPELGSSTVIGAGSDPSLGRARAAGARAATGRAVAFLVDHGYPAPRWAEALIDAYEQPWAAVGYAFELANPGARAARVAMLAQFLPWLSPAERRPTAILPGNMVSYRASVLRSVDGDLDRLLEVDHLLHERIRASGERMTVEPGAVVADECFESLAEVALANHTYSEMLAMQRASADDWSVLRRALYALGSPVGIPAMRLAHAVRAARRCGRLSSLWRAIPGVTAILFMAGLGEARGYLGATRTVGRRFLWRELNAPRASR
jgi:glycosyltransferase involved in cell wall biosynthesis